MMPCGVTRVPDAAVGRDDDAMRSRLRRRRRKLLHRAGLGIEPADVAALLIGEPDDTVRADRGIVGERAG